MVPTIAIILINWNGKADTLECLASLRADSYPNRRVIVVDNGSTDDSVTAVRAEFPEVALIETGANLGFTGGNNVGITRALDEGADYVFLLNNDTTVEPDALTRLVEEAERSPDYGLLTPLIHYYDRREEAWFAGSRIDLSRGVAVHDNTRVPGRDEDPVEIPWASGCAMLIRRDVMRQLGGFDDRFFLNWEDVDLSIRVRAFGKAIVLVPSARIYHKVNRSFRGAPGAGHYYHIRNNLLLVRLHGGERYRQAERSIIQRRFRECLRAVKSRSVNPIHLFSISVNAINDHFREQYGPANRPGGRLTQFQARRI